MYPRIILIHTDISNQRHRVVHKSEFCVAIESHVGTDSMGVEVWRSPKDMTVAFACTLIQNLLKTFTPTSP